MGKTSGETASPVLVQPSPSTTFPFLDKEELGRRIFNGTTRALLRAGRPVPYPRAIKAEAAAAAQRLEILDAFFISADQTQDCNYAAVRSFFEKVLNLKQELTEKNFSSIINVIQFFYGHLVNNQSLQQQLTTQLNIVDKIKQQLSFFNERLTLLNSKLKYLNTEQSKAINAEISLLQKQQETLLSKQQEIYNELITVIKSNHRGIFSNIISVCYLATQNKLINEFLHDEELYSLWEELLGLTDQLKSFEPNAKSHFDYINQHLMVECNATIQALSNTESLRDMPLAVELVKKCKEYATQVEDFHLFSQYHLGIRKDLEKNFAQKPYKDLLSNAIKIAKSFINDRSIDTSFLFPHTLKAQQLHGPIALLNEAMNKIAIATAFNNLISNLKDPIEDYTDAETREKIREYQQAASIYARQAMQDVLTAEKLAKSGYYDAATCRALNNKDATLFYVFDYKEMHTLQSWQKLILFCTELFRTNFSITLNEIDFARLNKDAELSTHQFLPEAPHQLAMYTSQYNLLPSI